MGSMPGPKNKFWIFVRKIFLLRLHTYFILNISTLPNNNHKYKQCHFLELIVWNYSIRGAKYFRARSNGRKVLGNFFILFHQRVIFRKINNSTAPQKIPIQHTPTSLPMNLSAFPCIWLDPSLKVALCN